MTTEFQPIDWATIEHHIQELPNAFSIRQAELHVISTQIIELRESHCTGTTHWRDAKNKKHKPKLYIIHRTNSSCPIHGKPKPGGRVRTYIGSNPNKIHTAQNAIDRGRVYTSCMAQLKTKSRAIKQAAHTLRQIYWSLDLKIPLPPADELPEPVPAP